VITPRSCIRSSRACTVPRATRSRFEASSTPTRGSAASSSISAASSASTGPRPLMVILYSNTIHRSLLIVKLTDEKSIGCAV